MGGPTVDSVSQRFAVYYPNRSQRALVDTEDDGQDRKAGKNASTIIRV